MIEFLDMNKEKGKLVASYLANLATSTSGYKAKDIFCYRFYHGLYNEDDFDYLWKVRLDNKVELAYPAKIRHIPIVRPKLNYLDSQYSLVELDPKVRAIDPKSINERMNKKYQEFIRTIDSNIQKRYALLNTQDEELQDKKQEFYQKLQQQQQQDQNSGMSKMMFGFMGSEIDRSKFITDEQLEKIEKYFRYDASDVIEEKAQKLLLYVIDRKNIKEQAARAFRDKMVTGKGIYFVHLNPGEKYPTFKAVTSMNVFWSSDEDTEYIQDCRWAVVRYRMTETQILDSFKSLVTKELLIKARAALTSTGFNSIMPTNPDGALDTYSNYQMYNGTRTLAGYDTFFIYWKSPRRVYIKKNPNPHDKGGFFTKFIDKYEAETWLKDKTIQKINDDDFSNDKGELLKIRYVNDVWEAINIGMKETVIVRRCPIQLRDQNYNVQLPIIGESFNHYSKQPYSLVWTTKDIQIEYNIVFYHRELMLAVAGVKGSIMDMGQKPENMSNKEWMYYKKLGTMWIDPSKTPLQGRRPSTFNQFQNYDDTVSPVIQELTTILTSLDETAAQITGISRQATSQIINTDQVGTSQLAVRQTQLLTEILFWEHDNVLRMALSRYMNLLKISQSDGGEYSLYRQDFGEDIFTIPKDFFADTEFETYLSNTGSNFRSVQELKQMMLQAWGKGVLPLDQFLKLYNINNLTQLEKTAEAFADTAKKLAQQAKQDDADTQKDLELSKIKLAKEYDKAVADQKNIVDKLKIDVSNALAQVAKQKLDIENKKIDSDEKVKTADIELKHGVESAYLEEQHRASEADEQLRAIQLQLEGVLNDNKLKHDKEQTQIKVESAERQVQQKTKIKK